MRLNRRINGMLYFGDIKKKDMDCENIGGLCD